MTDQPHLTAFRRAFKADGCVCIETGDGTVYFLPNPVEETNRWYSVDSVFASVVARGTVDLRLWKKQRREGTEK
jgi:hypothetical protein